MNEARVTVESIEPGDLYFREYSVTTVFYLCIGKEPWIGHPDRVDDVVWFVTQIRNGEVFNVETFRETFRHRYHLDLELLHMGTRATMV